jgi:hypothetical protein
MRPNRLNGISQLIGIAVLSVRSDRVIDCRQKVWELYRARPIKFNDQGSKHGCDGEHKLVATYGWGLGH